MSIYGFWQGPTYRPTTRDEMWESALDTPMSLGSTFWDQAKGGVLESFGLGTAIRTLSLPPAAQKNRARGESIEAYQARQERVKAITEDEYKASPYYREGVPWDSAMTEDRAAALATMYDAKRVREYFAEKRPITAFFGNLAGQATDPINYIPVAGPTVKAAAVARMGVVKGIAATAALDAAANTAIAGLATRETRRSFGDDVSWQAMVSEIATAALLGTAFGTVGGVLERRASLRADAMRSQAEVKVQTLKATQEARIALNEAIGGLANDGEVRLSQNAVAPIERMAEVARAADEFVVYHGSAADFGKFDIGKVGTGEGGSLQGRGLYFNDTRPVAEYYRDQLGGKRGILYEAGVAAKKEDFLDWRKPLSEQSAAVQAKIAKAIDLGPVEPNFTYSDRNGGKLYYRMGLSFVNYGKVTKQGNAYTVEAKKQNIGSFATVDEAEAALRKSFAESGVNWTGAMRSGQDVFETLGGRGKAEAALRDLGIPGVVEDARYGSGPSKDFSVFDDTLIRIRSKNGQPIDASPARPEPPPQGRAEAEAKVSKPENYKALAEQYRVDPEAGTFPEEAELRQLAQAGRLSDEDMAVLDDADAAFQDGVSYGEALKSVVGCLL